MEITAAAEWDWDNNLYSLCIEGNVENEALLGDETVKKREYPCNLYAGAALIFNCAGVDEQPNDSLDERWARLVTEMVFDGRSDYQSFLTKDIPVGGIFTGAERKKSVKQAEIFGGIPLEPFDPCYHLPCDNIDTINREVLDHNADAVAYSIYYSAMNDLKFLGK